MTSIFYYLSLFCFLSVALQVSTAHSQVKSQPPNLSWKFRTSGPLIAAPVSDGNNIFIGSYDSSFYSVNADGRVNWKYRTNGQIGSTAIVVETRIYFFSSDAVLYCLDKSTGRVVWKHKGFSGALPDRRYDWPDYYQSSPVVHNNVVYYGAGDGKVYALDAGNGAIIWTFSTGDVVHSRPALSGNKLVVGSFDGYLYCLNKQSGALFWKFKTTGQRYFPRGEINGNPVIHHDKVYVGARDYNLYAIDLEGGYCHWLKTFPQGWSLPITPNDSVLYVGTSDDRLLLAIDAETGGIHWRRQLGFNIFAPLVIVGNEGIVATLMGKISSVDLSTGDLSWTVNLDGYNANKPKYFKDDNGQFVDNIGKLLPNGDAILKMYRELGAVFSAPLIMGSRLIVASNDGTLYCFQLQREK